MTTIDGFPLSPIQRLQWARGGDRVRARLSLTGPVDRVRLAEALAVLAERHEALRCGFAEDTEFGVPVQYIMAEQTIPVVAPGEEPAVPLAVTLTDGELCLSGSPLSVDPASLGLLVRELSAVYAGRALPGGEERTQFIDVSEWQNEQEPYRALPANYAAPRLRAPADSWVYEPDATSAVRPLSAQTDATGLSAAAEVSGCDRQDLVLTAWLLALVPRLDVNDVMLAWYDDGRAVAGSADVVGPLGTHVPVRLTTAAPPAGVLATVRAALAESRRHSLVSVPATAEVTAGFGCHEAVTIPVGALPARAVAVDRPVTVGTPYLACELDATTARLTLHGGDTALLDSLVSILTTLPAALADPARLERIGARELASIMTFSGDPAPRGAIEVTLTDLLDAALAAGGDADAVVAPDGTVTFAQLSAAADAVADDLAARGIGKEDRVVVLAERSWRTVAAFVGLLRAGAVYVPVDPAWPDARVRTLANSVKAAVVLGPGPIAEPTLPRPRITVSPSDAAYIIFTSGSTGIPRPVVVEHAAVVSLWHALADRVYEGARERLRVAVNAPFTFDASIKQLIQLASGHTLLIVPEDVRRDGRALLDHLAAAHCDVFDCTPSHLRILLDELRADDCLPAMLLIGGEVIDDALWRRLTDLGGLRAINLYGPTECTVDVTAGPVAGSEPSIGRPLPGVRVWILDAHDRPVPLGAIGEVCVSGDRLARGYEGDAATTAARFAVVTLPDGTVGRIYRTGDLARFRPDGSLSYAGRVDDQVKINGYRVEPGEVAAILSSHPAISQAVVVTGSGGAAGLNAYAALRGLATAAVRPDRLAGVNPHETAYLYDEIFVQRVYHRGGITFRHGAVVFDVGANIGMFTLFALATVSDARVFAFEPLPDAFAALGENLAGRGAAVTLLPYGLSGTEREERFAFYPGYSMMSGQLSYADPEAEVAVVKRYLANRRDRGDAESAELLDAADELLADRFGGIEQTARLRRLSDVIDEYGVERIDLLKIDVQRAEEDVLRGLDERHWPLIAQLAVEVHDEPGTPTEGRLARLIAELAERGFRVVAEQEAAMAGTGRHALYAVRPEYDHDPRPVAAGDATAAPPDALVLRNWLAERLPEYLVPNTVTILDALPLTAHGKIDRAALPPPAAAAAAPHAAPANAAERALLDIWIEILGRDGIGVEDAFFQHGGDSIRAIQVRAAAARRGLVFLLRDLIKHQTIRELVSAAGLRAEGDSEAEGTQGSS
jgi:amino acid adenylation domain-containing protein/FkbM family methyltransferase